MEAKELAQKILSLRETSADLIDFSDEVFELCEEVLTENTSAPEKAVIEGWLTRSKSGNKLIFSDNAECKRGNQVWYHKEGANVIDLSETGLFDNDIFPSITWESESRKARIEITLIDVKE